MNRLSMSVILLSLMACGDDASSSDGADSGSSATGGSAGGVLSSASLLDGPMAACPPACDASSHGSQATFCTEPCSGPDDPCPLGTQCIANFAGSYAACYMACDNGGCPEKMRCLDGACLPE